MKKEIAVIPNPNQIIIIHKIQHSLCSIINSKADKEVFAVPVYPFYVKFDESISLNDKIQSLIPEKLDFDKGIFFISIKAEVNQNKINGRIELCRFSKTPKEFSPIFSEIETDIKLLKKISPAKLAEIEINEGSDEKFWTIKSEKWIKF
ncbi:hypothetical protein [Treponema sp.]|uniref:hypothetical protein n=1 Tax=Treponema sp. TaxID=166 RepID=UPI00388D3C99